MKWPRGRYNGGLIAGIRVTFAINILRWQWKPYIGHYCGACHWLCFYSWWSAEYE